jgi:hypothetical protein
MLGWVGRKVAGRGPSRQPASSSPKRQLNKPWTPCPVFKGLQQTLTCVECRKTFVGGDKALSSGGDNVRWDEYGRAA